MKFALATEGETDQISIKNILCGFFDDPNLDQDIARLQPPSDQTNQNQKKQDGFGGWLMLLEYLRGSRFRDDVLNNEHVIVQIDTDISTKKGFDVPQTDQNNQELPVETLVEKVIARLIEEIESNKDFPPFYQENKTKIIFCISVHSLECWILSYYSSKSLKSPKIKGCAKELSFLFEKETFLSREETDKKKKAIKKKRSNIPMKYILSEEDFDKKKREIKKNYNTYNALTEPFLKKKNLMKAKERDPSLKLFLNRVEKVDQ